MVRFTVLIVAVVLAFLVAAPEVTARRYTVGDNMFWSPNTNYTIWSQDKHFYIGDWLYFVSDRNQHNVLEVTKTDYESCISNHPIRNWTRGFGRDIVILNETRHYYFLDGRGGCYGGMKLAIKVEKLPPPPEVSPVEVEKLPPSPEIAPVGVEKLPPSPETEPVEVEKVPSSPKVAPVEVEKVPSAPKAAPIKNIRSVSMVTIFFQFMIPIAFFTVPTI